MKTYLKIIFFIGFAFAVVSPKAWATNGAQIIAYTAIQLKTDSALGTASGFAETGGRSRMDVKRGQVCF
jgi:hypothetical protein